MVGRGTLPPLCLLPRALAFSTACPFATQSLYGQISNHTNFSLCTCDRSYLPHRPGTCKLIVLKRAIGEHQQIQVPCYPHPVYRSDRFRFNMVPHSGIALQDGMSDCLRHGKAERSVQGPQAIGSSFNDLLPIIAPSPSKEWCINQPSAGKIRLSH